MRFRTLGVVFALSLTACQKPKLDDVGMTRSFARAIHRSAETWRSEHPERCPTVVQLQRDKHLDAAHPLTDPWGSEYVIDCDGVLQVRSSGPDRQHHTADDVRVP